MPEFRLESFPTFSRFACYKFDLESQLYWSKKPKAGSLSAPAPLREYRQVIGGDQLTFQIPGLEADTIYMVQVRLNARRRLNKGILDTSAAGFITTLCIYIYIYIYKQAL